MGVLGDFLSPESGQKRTKWRNEKADDLYEGLQYYLGPTGVPDKLKAVAELLQFTDAGDVYEAQAGAEDMRNAEDVWGLLQGAGRTATGVAAAVMPVVGAKMANNLTDAGIDWLGSAVDDVMAGYDPAVLRSGVGPTAKADPATTRGQEILDLLSTNPSAVTDDMLDMGDPVLNARLNEYLWNNYDLPMDEASRMARAEGMGDFYHSTRADFTEFDKGDVGYHVGTDEQAQQRLINTRRERGVEGESILPLRARIENSLQSADAGEWDDARFAGRTLRDAGLPVDDIIDEAEELAPQFEDNDYWKWSPENEGFLGDLGYSLNDAGYDSVKYANEAENAYGDIPGLTRQGKALSNALRKERSELRAAIVGRRPPPPDDPAEIESWLAMPEPRPTAEEARRLAEIDAELDRIDTVMVNDGASYILTNPSNIRSRFARFDPRLAHLRNLNAGLAGGLMFGAMGRPPSEEGELREYLGGT